MADRVPSAGEIVAESGKKYKLEVREGRTVRVYESGAVLDDETKKLLAPAAHTLITAENSPRLHAERKKKLAAALRARIRDVHNASGRPKAAIDNWQEAGSSVAAFAESGAMLYEDIVLAEPGAAGVYPRDRIDAWKTLGQAAEVLGDGKQQPEAQPVQALETLAALAPLAELARDILEHKRAQVVDAIVVEKE